MTSFLPARGRPQLMLTFEVVDELTPHDLISLAFDPGPRTGVPPLQRIRAIHHQAARLVALGFEDTEIAIQIGRTPERIRHLKVDPSFAELVAYYAEQVSEIELNDGERVRGKLLDNAELAADILSDRLNDPIKADEIPVSELRQIQALGFDRTVAPPKIAQSTVSTPMQITFNMGTKDIRPDAAESAKDITPSPTPVLESKE